MDTPSVYIGTSIVSYLAARPSRNPVSLRNQQLTHAWWNTHRARYALYTSELVIGEAADGDPGMAKMRLALLRGIPLLELDEEVTALAAALSQAVGLPHGALADAVHISVAAVAGMAHLLTWNCRHIANPALALRLERSCRSRGYDLPALCTPAALMGG